MIKKEILLDISDERKNRLKLLNIKIINHLEEGFDLRLSILNELKMELSGIVQANPELVKTLEAINRSGDYYDALFLDNDNEILNLPWTMAIDPVSGKQLGDIQQLLISKALPGYFKTSDQSIAQLAPPLKILIMISSPEDAGHKDRLSYEDEEFLILKAFQPLLSAGLAQIDFTDDGSCEALKRKITANKYHILHYSGHAVFNDESGYLMLEQPLNLNTDIVNAEDFADVLNCNPDYRIPIVVLASCQTARGDNETGIRGVTNHLLKVGVSAVLSMGMSIKDKYATHFCAKFYGEIAKKQNILLAFNLARNSLKQFESSELARAGAVCPVGLQWIIPNLYRSVHIEHPVDWTATNENLSFSSHQLIFKQNRLLLKHDKDYLFIGRRKDKARILPCLFDKKPIMLKGQGGVGKTSMAEHLVQRSIAADGKTVPFLFDETIKSIDDILKIVQRYLLENNKLDITKLNLIEKGIEKFQYLIARTAELCAPVFIFDNLESFQKGPGDNFADEYLDILEIIEHLCRDNRYGVILTGRYTIPGLEYAKMFDLNQVSINDFWKKCHHLELVRIAEIIHNSNPANEPLHYMQAKPLQFIDIVQLLHQTFGGNYRALEIFNELCKNGPEKMEKSLTTLENFREKYKNETNEVRLKMSCDLVFAQLLSLLDSEQNEVLALMSHFRVPAQQFALHLQYSDEKDIEDCETVLLHLHGLTLLEISLDVDTNTAYYYCSPIVKELLAGVGATSPNLQFDHDKAGVYYFYNYHNISSSLTDYEEAFYHFNLAKNRDKIQKIGDKLSNFYYNRSMYDRAYYFTDNVYKLLEENSSNSILNRIGLILDMFGEYDQALRFYKKTLSNFQKTGDKQGEGVALNNMATTAHAHGDYDTALKYLKQSLIIQKEIGDKSSLGGTLNNISQIYRTLGDFDTALKYLEQSLKIMEESGNKSGEGTTLNNISQIYDARGDYDTALKYLQQSLKIRQEIGDKSGEGGTLNNISQIYRVRGDYDIAFKYLEQSLKIRQEIGDKSGLISTLHNMAMIANTNGDMEKDWEYTSRAYALATETKNAEGLFYVGKHYGQLLYDAGQKEEGLNVVRNSYEIGRNAGFPEAEDVAN